MYGITVLFRSVVSLNKLRVRFHSNNKKQTQRLLEFLATMPKANSARIAEAQRQRQIISKKAQNYGPSTIYLQVLGSGARGVPNTLYLFTDQKRYLFNCGESTQRLAHEHKVKLTRLDHIFITNKTWRNLGGLPGLSLTLQDVGVPNITLHGPEGLDELYNATRRFVIMKDMNVTMAKCSPSEDFDDNVMTVKYVLLCPKNILQPDINPFTKKPKLSNNTTDKVLEEFTHDDTDYYRPDVGKMKNSNNKEKVKGSPEKAVTKKKVEKILNELQGNSKCTVAYICTFKKRMGTLDLEKCVEKGVKPGPMLGQLKNGHDVILPDGTLVRSKDVKTPDQPGPVFIVMEVPDISYLREQEFSLHFDNGVNPKDNVPTVIVHCTPTHVVNHPTYQAFMSMFGESTKHLILNESNSCLGSEAVHRSQHKLHQLDPRVFPLLRDVSIPAVWDSRQPVCAGPEDLEQLKNRIALAQFQNIISMKEGTKADGDVSEDHDGGNLDVIRGRTLTMYHLRPKKELDRSAEPKLHIQDYIQESMDVEGFANSLQQFHELVGRVRPEGRDLKDEYPKVVFLGTGSCIPSKTRNTSAIVLQIDESRSMLMDCGEGTFGQLVRFYGPKRVNSFLRTLKAIYVSHLHADHHIGLIGLLQARRQAFEELESQEPYHPLHLLAPGQIVTWLSLYDQQFERIRDHFVLIPNQTLLYPKRDLSDDPAISVLPAATLADIGLVNISTCLVAHCPNAFGVALQLHGGHKITYSGDTIPCEELARIGQDSTLLIHEATMEDELADEARTKMHSTTSQAIEMGRLMNARYTLLTHFSQRYARIPRLGNHLLKHASVGIAFDNMQVTIDDLPLLPKMYAPLQLMFAEHCVGLELKAANRAKRAKRSPSSTEIIEKEQRQESLSYRLGNDILTQMTNASNLYGESNSFRPQNVVNNNTKLKNANRGKSSSPVKHLNPFGVSGFTSPATAVFTNLAIKKPKLTSQVHQSLKDARPRFNTSPRIQMTNTSSKRSPTAISETAKFNTSLPIIERRRTLHCNKQNQKPRDGTRQLTRRNQIEMLKSTFCREVQQLTSAANVTVNGAKWHGPRLEDIKSSRILLGKERVIDRNIETEIRNVYEKQVPNKPNPLNESQRRLELRKAKEKYKSRWFWDETRFTQIEGLNWISWK